MMKFKTVYKTIANYPEFTVVHVLRGKVILASYAFFSRKVAQNWAKAMRSTLASMLDTRFDQLSVQAQWMYAWLLYAEVGRYSEKHPVSIELVSKGFAKRRVQPIPVKPGHPDYSLTENVLVIV